MGEVLARSASALTSMLLKGSRFLVRMLATSYPVHPQSPIKTNSIGLFAVSVSPSTAIVWPLLATAEKRCFSVHVARAVIIGSPQFANSLSPVVGQGFGMDQYPVQLRGGL